ncbi:hypothetical protein JT358_00515 [Micrococcales bacterium 31B]|nr:hypothetical protein [Micrococcales bacterium 31B]
MPPTPDTPGPTGSRHHAAAGVFVGLVGFAANAYLSLGVLSLLHVANSGLSMWMPVTTAAGLGWPCVLAVALMLWPRSRRFGAGLLIGYAAAYLIFVGVCTSLTVMSPY